MTLIDWSKKLSVHINSIDNQHKKLIYYLNRFYEGMMIGYDRALIRETFKDLLEYTEVHFTHEEILFVTHDYPKRDEHIKEHEKFIKALKELHEKFELSEKKDSNIKFEMNELMVFMKNWLEDHILVKDMEYSEFMAKKGVE